MRRGRGNIMEELKKELDEAFRLLCGITVSGDCVELMAAAKEHLRRAYGLAKEAGKDG